MASTPADTPGDTPRSDPWTSSTPAPFNPGHRQRPNARPPLNPNPREPSTAAKAAAAAMGRVPASAYRSRSASPSPREGGRGFESLRGHFAENVGADAVDPNPGAVAGRGRSSGSGGGSSQRQRPRRPGRLHDWSDYPYDEDGGGGSSGRARRGVRARGTRWTRSWPTQGTCWTSSAVERRRPMPDRTTTVRGSAHYSLKRRDEL